MSSDQTELLVPLLQFPLPAPQLCLQSLQALEAGSPPRPCALAPSSRRLGQEGKSTGVDTASRVGSGPPFSQESVRALACLPVSEVASQSPPGGVISGSDWETEGRVVMGASEPGQLASCGSSCWHLRDLNQVL